MGFRIMTFYFFFNKSATESTSWWRIFTVFNPFSWMVILLSFIFLATVLTSFSSFDAKSFCWSIAALSKAFLAHEISLDCLMTKSKKSKYVLIVTISFLGGFVYWYFTGVLISLLTVPTQKPLLTSLDDLLHKHNFKLTAYSGGISESFIINWATKSSKNMEVYRKFIKPNLKWGNAEVVEELKTLGKNGNQNEAFLLNENTFEDAASRSKHTFVIFNDFFNNFNS